MPSDRAATPTIRQLLVRLVLVTQVPAIIAIAGLLVAEYQKTHHHVTDTVGDTAMALSVVLRDRFETVQRHLEALAQHAPPPGGDIAEFHARASKLRDDTRVDAVVLIKPSGEQVVNTRLPIGARLPMHTPETMRMAAITGARSVHDLAVVPVANVLAAGVGVPVVRDSKIIYALNAGIEEWQFRDMLEQSSKLPQGWVATIADSRGVIVARSEKHERYVGKPLPAALKNAIDSAPRSVVGFLDDPGSVLAYRKSSTHGWTMIVAAPRWALYVPVWRWAGYLLLGFSAIVLVSMLAAMRLRQHIAVSIDQLRQAAQALPGQARPPMRKLWFQEAEELGQTLEESAIVIERANGEVRQAQERVEAILENALSGIVVCDEQQRVLLFNRAAEAMFGQSRAAMTGEPVATLFGAGGRETYEREAQLARCASRDPATSLAQAEGARRDGSTFPLEFSVSSLVDSSGTRFYTLIARDISERVRYEASLQQAHRQVQEVNEGFERALMKEMDARQAAIARELHDALGSTLAGVSMLLAGARSHLPEPIARKLIEKSQEQVQEAADRVRKISRGIMPAGSERGAFLQAIEQFAHDLSELKQVTCTVRARGNFDGLDAEVGGHLYRIVQEATTNAIRHGRGTHVRIRLARCGARCRLTITDNGCGCDTGGVPLSHPGLGLKSMNARARAIDGHFEMRCGQAPGCTVRVEWRDTESKHAQAQPTPRLPVVLH